MGIDNLQVKFLFPSTIACYTAIHSSLLSGDAGRVLTCAYGAVPGPFPSPLFKDPRTNFNSFLPLEV